MRYIACLLIFIVTVSGLQQAYAYASDEFQTQDAHPVTLAAPCPELAGNDTARRQADPTAAADAQWCQAGADYPPPCPVSHMLWGTAYAAPHLPCTSAGNPARAPPNVPLISAALPA